MKFGIYCIKDNINGFMTPTLDNNDPSAVRNFANAMTNTKSLFYTHPSDFSLYKVGEFDTDSGIIDSYNSPVFIETGTVVYVQNFGLKEYKNEI